MFPHSDNSFEWTNLCFASDFYLSKQNFTVLCPIDLFAQTQIILP